MRRFTLLLCLLVVAVLGWVIRSGEACTAREHVDAVPPKDAPRSEGCKYVFSGYLGGLYKMRGSCLITYQQLSPAIELRPQSGSSILSRLNQHAVRTYGDRSGSGDQKTPSHRRSGVIGASNLSVTLGNNALTWPSPETEF